MHDTPAVAADLGHHRVGASLHCRTNRLNGHPTKPADEGADRRAANGSGRDERHTSACIEHGLRSPLSELIAVAPGRKLRAERLADSNQRRSVTDLREPNVVRRHPFAGIAIQLFGLLNRLPPFVERREVPALTRPADHPQSAARSVERQAFSDRKCLDGLVRAKRFVAENAGRIHGLAQGVPKLIKASGPQ